MKVSRLVALTLLTSAAIGISVVMTGCGKEKKPDVSFATLEDARSQARENALIDVKQKTNKVPFPLPKLS